jgi:hypothetical protein
VRVVPALPPPSPDPVEPRVCGAVKGPMAIHTTHPYRTSLRAYEPGLLWGWEGIADYFGRPLATVRRFHRWRPLPLSRIGRHVVVPKAAIDRWVLKAPSPGGLRRAR